MEQLGDITFMMNWYEEFISMSKYKMVFGVSRDESILDEKSGQGYISIDGKRWNNMESPWVVLLEAIKKDGSELRVARQFVISQGNQQCRSADNATLRTEDNVTIMKLARINDERERNIPYSTLK